MSYFAINRVVLVGRLTRDPELRALPKGTSVCSLRIACNSAQRDASGEFTERPNYFDVTVFGARGENVANYMRKGGRVAIDGRLDWREWETAEEQKRQAVSIVAETVQFLDPPKDRSEIGDRLEGEDGGEGEDRQPVGVGASDGDELVF
jgi:single-strand DNA-binding protein